MGLTVTGARMCATEVCDSQSSDCRCHTYEYEYLPDKHVLSHVGGIHLTEGICDTCLMKTEDRRSLSGLHTSRPSDSRLQDRNSMAAFVLNSATRDLAETAIMLLLRAF